MVKKHVLPCMLGLMSLFCLLPFSATISKTVSKPTSLSEPRYLTRREAAPDYSSEVEIPDGNLVVSATSSTKTSMGQSFTFMFSTGGQGWCDATTSFLLAPDDADFDEYLKDFNSKTAEEREKITEAYEKGEYEPVHFNSYVYSLAATTNVKDIYIPRSLTRNHIFNLDVTRLGVDVVPDWTGITSINIPKDVTEIYSDSFQNVPEGMIFNVEPDANLDGWAADWNHGAKVNYGYAYPTAKAEPFSKAGASKYGDEKQNFIIGWYPKEGEQKPLVLEYQVSKDGGAAETRYFEFAPTSASSLFECVGRQVNDYTKSLYCDIPLKDGEVIDFSSAVLHNIYRAKSVNDVAITEPDLSQAYNIEPKQGFTRLYDIKDFIECSFTGLSTFSGYSAIDLNIDISEANVYEHLKANYYNTNLNDINSGKLKIRYRLTSLTLCSFRIDFVDSLKESTLYTIDANNDVMFKIANGYKSIREMKTGDQIFMNNDQIATISDFKINKETDKSGNEKIISYSYSVSNSGVYAFRKDAKITTPIAQFKLEKSKGNKVSFLFKNGDVAPNFSAEKIREVSFVGLFVTLDLMAAKGPIARSNVITRFGYHSIMPYSESASLFNVNAFLIILLIAYTVAFVGVTLGLYFYLKNKYKNDEFRRMKSKSFFVKAAIFLVGSLVVLFDIVFIVLRASALNNAIVVYNPADAYIIILSVLSVVIIGYFIKFMVGVVKANRERRRIIKLKLNEDVLDDGTN